MSTDHNEHESLDSFFTPETDGDDALLVGASDTNDATDVPHFNEHDHEVDHSEGSELPKKKSLFKRWYFWVGCLVLFTMLVGGLYMQQMMALNSQSSLNAYPVVDVPHPSEPVQAAPASVASITVAPAVVPSADGSAATSAVSMPTENADKNDPSKSRIESLEKQVSLLSSELEEQKKDKQAALDKIAALEKSHTAKSGAVKKVSTLRASKKKDAKRADGDTDYFADYHIDAITPGQARVTHGLESAYVIVGSTIKNAKVIKINPDSGEVITTNGVIR